MPHTPQKNQPVQIVVAPEFAEILAERHARRNAQAIADGHGPLEDKSPFITRAELEKQKARRLTEKAPRGRLTHAARLKIATRTQSNPSFARHARKCAICRHPEVDSIESDFVNWRSENTIALNYQLPSRSSVFRHAAAVGLLERRRLNLRGVCERIIEHVEEAPPTGMAVLRALRIYAHITEEGHWVEPPKRSIVTHIHVTSADHEPSASTPAEPSVQLTNMPSSELSRVGCGKQPKKVATECSPAVAETVPDLDYLPHWARGIRLEESNISDKNGLDASQAPEILIGPKNTSRGRSTTGKKRR